MGKFIIVDSKYTTSEPNRYNPIRTSAESSNIDISGNSSFSLQNDKLHSHTILLGNNDFIKTIKDPLSKYLDWYNITSSHDLEFSRLNPILLCQKIWSVKEIETWIEHNIDDDVIAQKDVLLDTQYTQINNEENWQLVFTGGYKQKLKFDQWFNNIKTVHSFSFTKKIFEEQYIRQWLISNSTLHRIINDYNYYYVQFPDSHDTKAAEFVLVFGQYFN